MKKFKHVLSILATTLLAAAFAGCGTYTPPENPDNPDNPDNPGIDTPIVNPDPVNPAEDVFKVSLVWNGNPFTQSNYSGITGIQAQWTDVETKEVFRAAFDKDGVAKSPDLDGDYSVTLVNLPDGYTYEPNIYGASNDFKETRISLYQLTPISLNADPYAGAPFAGERYYVLNSIGAYRVSLENADSKVFFQFRPDKNGMYTVTSMVDVTANEINPIMELYNGNSQYIAPTPAKTQDDGGSENTYTKNFKMEYTLSPEEVGGVMIFRLFSTCRNADAYPMTVDFILDRDGDFANRYDAAEDIKPTEKFDEVASSILNPAGTFTYCARRPGVVNRRLDQKSVKLYDDGYYYYYDSLTDTRLERVYAQLRKRTEVSDESFYSGGHVRLYYIVGADGVPKNYEEFIRGADGYGAHCNGDGVYPVTEELKEFLQAYSVSQRYFNDGNGWAETEAKYNSDEDSQWMFACGYYAE
ncbi:MAG: hypothetical protein K2O62_05390 [Clostridia bacterium]|nr:hypothetical protein [Clostridia bacterium]